MPGTNKYLTTKVLGYAEINNQNHLILKEYSDFETFILVALLKVNELNEEPIK